MDVDATTAADVAQTTVYGLSVFSSYVAAAATVATHQALEDVDAIMAVVDATAAADAELTRIIKQKSHTLVL